MKIIETEEVPKFKPVTVVFESQAEINYIAMLLGASSQHIADFVNISLNTHTLFNEFNALSSEDLYDKAKSIVIQTTKEN